MDTDRGPLFAAAAAVVAIALLRGGVLEDDEHAEHRYRLRDDADGWFEEVEDGHEYVCVCYYQILSVCVVSA